jgi:UDP-glucuronate 4-epimerase
MQPGDVVATYADVEALVKEVGYRPSTNLDDGIAAFVEWYKDFYKIDL